jgi:hypothetical protein
VSISVFFVVSRKTKSKKRNRYTTRPDRILFGPGLFVKLVPSAFAMESQDAALAGEHLVDRVQLLRLSAPEMTVLVGGRVFSARMPASRAMVSSPSGRIP